MNDGPLTITRDIWCEKDSKTVELKVIQGDTETEQQTVTRYFQEEATLKADCQVT